MAEEQVQPPTPDQVSEALRVLLNAADEDRERVLDALRREIEEGPHVIVHGSQAVSHEHALSASLSITITAAGTLSTVHDVEITDQVGATDVMVPASLVQAVTKPVDDLETAAQVLLFGLAAGAFAYALVGRTDVAAVYLAALETLREMIKLFKGQGR